MENSQLLENVKWRYRGLWPANRENEGRDPETLSASKRYQVVDLPHGRLISTDRLDQVQEKIDATRRTKKKSCRDGHVYLLSGILEHEDGTRYSGQPAKDRQYRYYYNKANGIRIECSKIEEKVKELVRSQFSSHERFQRMVEDGVARLHSDLPKIDARIRQIHSQLDGIEREDQALQDGFQAAKLSDPTYAEWLKERVAAVSRRRRELQTELAVVERNRAEITRKRGFKSIRDAVRYYLDEGFEGLNGVQQREIIQKIVHSVTLSRANTVEIKIYGKPNWRGVVTSEAKSSGSDRDGGSDGT